MVAALLDLGERMRTAQAKGDATALSAARPERRARIEALTAAAGRVATAHASTFAPSTQEAVRATAVAALADGDSGAALASGRLLRPLAYAGFGEVELDDAVAPLFLVPSPTGHEDEAGQEQSTSDAEEDGAARAREAADRARQEARSAARDALRVSERELSAARLQRAEAEQALDTATRQVADLEKEVGAASATLGRLDDA